MTPVSCSTLSLSFLRPFDERYPLGLLEKLNAKENGDWIIECNEAFKELIPLAGDTHKKFDQHSEETVFVGYSSGYKTNRDAWSYNFSRNLLAQNMENMIREYNIQVSNGKIIYDHRKIKWDGTLESSFERKDKTSFDSGNVRLAAYRPFNKR